MSPLLLQVSDVPPRIYKLSKAECCKQHDSGGGLGSESAQGVPCVVSVWEHKTTNAHGTAKIAVNARGYSLLIRYTGEREGSDLVFLTKSGDKLTHIG